MSDAPTARQNLLQVQRLLREALRLAIEAEQGQDSPETAKCAGAVIVKLTSGDPSILTRMDKYLNAT